MKNSLIISSRYCGPKKTGNGGYVGGLVANYIEGPAEVRLYRPPPLETTLQIVQIDEGVSLLAGEDLVAKGKAALVELDVPEPPSLEMAVTASEHYVGFEHHFFPTCFVCGPERKEGEGLRIFPGRVSGENMVASQWIPAPDLAGADGLILPEFIWASLDCPGAFAFGRDDRPMVLGTMAVEILAPLGAGETCVVIGWPVSSDGRKHFSGTAVFTASGELIAKARATWIELESLDALG